VYAKDPSMLSLIATHLDKVIARSLKQDLRCVLKAGLAGLPTRPTEWELSKGYKSEVRYLYTGVISSSGLLPYPAPKRLRVSMVLGGNVWVKRPIQSSEILAAMDVPEQMIRTRNIHLSAEELLLLVDTPVKMLQGLAESVKLALTLEEPNTPDSKRIRKGSDCVSPPSVEIGETEDSNKAYIFPNMNNLKAAKSDDAKVPIEMWEHYLFKGLEHRDLILSRDWKTAIRTLRKFGLRMWMQDKWKSFYKWKRKKLEQGAKFTQEMHEAACDSLERAMDSTWWDWPQGSRPFFWNWPSECQDAAMSGWKWHLCKGFEPIKKPQ